MKYKYFLITFFSSGIFWIFMTNLFIYFKEENNSNKENQKEISSKRIYTKEQIEFINSLKNSFIDR